MKNIELYPYQSRAVTRMTRSNVMLAFDPGLGKTVSSIAAVEALRDLGDVTAPGVVVAPASLKFQWRREIHKFTDRTAVVVDGPGTQRLKQYQQKYDYLVMSYDIFVRDWHLHSHVNGFLIADEASALRGFDTRRTKHFKKVRDGYPIRFALTATPIENGKAEEIFSIMEWLDPDVLGRFWDFQKRYIRRNSMGWIEGYRNLDHFHRTIKPYVIRKAHDDPDVAGVLPAVVHKEPRTVRLAQSSQQIYDKMVHSILTDLDEVAEKAVQGRLDDHVDGKLMAKVQTLRMFLDHPGLLLEHEETNRFAEQVVAAHQGFFDRRVLPSPKFSALTEYVQDFLDVHPSNKVVVFTSFVGMAKRIADLPWSSVLFHGGMSAVAKDEAKQKFVSDPSCRVFVSTDAGGYGLDLPQANLVINYDLPWSAGALVQRNGRIRRASSEWGHVTVQELVVEGSLEERMLQVLEHKMALATAVLTGNGITAQGALASDLDSLRSFLVGSLEVKSSA